jgi:hypothetical protein
MNRKRRTQNSVAGEILSMVVALFCLAGTAVAQPAAKNDRWEEWLGRTKQEGKITVFAPPLAEFRPSLIQAFQKAFREITAEYQAGSVAPLVEKIRAEYEQKRAVWTSSSAEPRCFGRKICSSHSR